ncbi:hypothetical protein SDRG_15267 [Saprolegnia diclina VS20]|uniref:DAGKc domain-containing protein n=1 Tax=Saprolegnia diclina (strain VS20) TaxID=1156394 RepID=T0Q0S0_SAPDV|nr:hypothetical protein SDRG_15267 [Saprolegnia diclina VS20]EQC26935.1 hypothetical protein SDRG_15267 [Saprolegnia diclina VS20]|eukprot:XP_008619656.1 hypothetical protein SDRG_15267 [Saprolegnia diclina VS20]
MSKAFEKQAMATSAMKAQGRFKTSSRGTTTTFVVCMICGANAHAHCATARSMPAHCMCKQAAVLSGSTCDWGPRHELELPAKFARIPQPKAEVTPPTTRGRRVFVPMGVVPAGLLIKHRYSSTPAALDVEIELPSEWKAKTLLVLINGGSGGQMGDKIANDLRKLLNPLQIYNISGSCPPIGPLTPFKTVKGLQILACGGAVGWVRLVQHGDAHSCTTAIGAANHRRGWVRDASTRRDSPAGYQH